MDTGAAGFFDLVLLKSGTVHYYILLFDVQTALKVSEHILDAIERLGQFLDSGLAIPDEWMNEQGY